MMGEPIARVARTERRLMDARMMDAGLVWYVGTGRNLPCLSIVKGDPNESEVFGIREIIEMETLWT